MTTAFNEEEILEIKEKLKEEASRWASTLGMRKTTVEQLTKYANISKGAFYKFYDSKEHLFFEIVEDWHIEVYSEAVKVLEENKDLRDSERVAKVLISIFEIMEKNSLMDLFENDMPYILRKLPKDILNEHYRGDNIYIEELIKSQNLKIKVTTEFASATVRTLMMTLFHKNEIGELYQEVIESMIYAICNRIFE